MIEERCQAIRQTLSEQLRKRVDEAYWAIVLDGGRLIHLLEQNHERAIDMGKAPSIRGPERVDGFHEVGLDDVPGQLEKTAREAVRAGCLVIRQCHDNQPHFLLRDQVVEHSKIDGWHPQLCEIEPPRSGERRP